MFGCVNKTSRRRIPAPQGRGGISSPTTPAPPPRRRPASTSAHSWPQRGLRGGGEGAGAASVAVPWARARRGEEGGARVGRPGLGRSPRPLLGPQLPTHQPRHPIPRPGLALTGGRSSQCEAGRPGPGCGEPDLPGRRGRGGAGARGAGSDGARLPPPFIQRSPGAEGLRRPTLHGGSAGGPPPQPARRAGAGPGRLLAAALSAPRRARATMSDPAVNAQLDGIISDFEGGCWPPTARQGAPRGGPPRETGARTGRRDRYGAPSRRGPPHCPAPAQPPRWTPFGGRGDRAPLLAPALALRATAGFPSFYCCLCLSSDNSLLEGSSSKDPGAQFSSRLVLQSSPLHSPRRPRGPGPWGGLGELVTRPPRPARRTAASHPLAYISFGAGAQQRIRAGEGPEWTRPRPRRV